MSFYLSIHDCVSFLTAFNTYVTIEFVTKLESTKIKGYVHCVVLWKMKFEEEDNNDSYYIIEPNLWSISTHCRFQINLVLGVKS